MERSKRLQWLDSMPLVADASKTRVYLTLYLNAMIPQQLAALYEDLQRAFDARPSDLNRCGSLLAQLKVLSFQSYSFTWQN